MATSFLSDGETIEQLTTLDAGTNEAATDPSFEDTTPTENLNMTANALETSEPTVDFSTTTADVPRCPGEDYTDQMQSDISLRSLRVSKDGCSQ